MGEQRLSESELYIMEQFWRQGAMKTDAVAALVAGREWKRTTLLTFLSRLIAKGMLEGRSEGKGNLYTPRVSREEYYGQEGSSFLNEMFGGSARNFLAAMAQGGKLSDADIAELRRWLEEQEVESDA